MDLQVKTFASPGFGENSYIVWRDGSKTAVAIDPGNSIPPILRLLESSELEVAAVLLTHAHLDHIEGVARLVRETAAPVYLHPADRFLYDHVARQAQEFGMTVEAPPDKTRTVRHGDVIDVGDVSYDVLHVPGHSPGHVMYHVADANRAFVGDVVFQGSIGRSDLPGGDFTQLMESIRSHVLTLADDTTLYPGHGPPTTVGHERTTNPFLVPTYGGGFA